ncbi:MAG: SusC/RagA family TonB-linked outer membrane protein [Tenacibaculum sp.]
MRKLLNLSGSLNLLSSLKINLSALFIFAIFFAVQANVLTCSTHINKVEFQFVYKINNANLNRTIPAKTKRIIPILNRAVKTSYLVDKQILSANSIQPNPNRKVATTADIQKTTITGKVTDSNGVPLPGANIVEKGIANGAQADFNGNFSISVANQNTVLIISYIGFITQEISVSGQNNITVVLKENTSLLEEVVIVGFGTQKKENLTGAVQSVEFNKVISDRPLSNSAIGLQGTIPGLVITSNSGEPGAEGVGINLRGFTSINGGSPLILVDNVPVSLNDINPQDIKTVTVLKDASATSIYGARAAFGVILISTKRPQGDKISFEYSATTSFSEPTQILKKASPIEFVTAMKDWGRNPYWALGEDIATWLDFLEQYNANPNNFPEGFVIKDGIRYRLEENDHVKDFYSDPGFASIHNISLGQVTDKSSYRLSLGYTTENGIMVSSADKFERYNINTFLKSKLTDNLTAEFNMYYRNSNKLRPRAQYNDIVKIRTFEGQGLFEEPDGTLTPYDTPSNIVSLEKPTEDLVRNLRLFGKLTYNLLPGFKLTGEYSFQTNNFERYVVNLDPRYIRFDRLAPAGGFAENTSYSNTQSNSVYKATNIYANFDKTIGKNHNFNLLAGFNYEQQEGKSVIVSRGTLINPELPSISGATQPINANDSFYEWAVAGYFGRFTYNYKSKYFLEVNGRYDGSSRFLKGNNFGFFPSASVGWNISNESFMEKINFVSLFKLRASYGEVGNQIVLFPGTQIQNYYPAIPTFAPFTIGYINPNTNQNTVSLGVPGLISDGFTWETVRTTNFGIDLNLFNNKFTSSLDIFKRETLNMITSGPELPSIIGATPPTANAADLETTGFDLSITWSDRIGENFTYQIGFNLHDNKSIITKFPGNENNLLNQFYVGQNINEIWGFVTDGYYTEADYVDGSLSENLTGGTLLDGVPSYQGISENPGDIKYKDLNGDGIIFTGNNTLEDPGDRKIIGNSNRRFQYGFNVTFGYKNFDMSVFGNGVGKRDIWLGNPAFWPLLDQFGNVFKHQLDYWTPDNQNAYYPRNYSFDGSNYGNSRRVQTKYLQNGSYLTIKNITMGYNFPLSILDKLSLTKLRVSISSENLFLFDHLPDGLHPEFANLGSGAAYPFQRKYALGVNIGF